MSSVPERTALGREAVIISMACRAQASAMGSAGRAGEPLDGVGQCIHAGGGGEHLRHGRGQPGIAQGDLCRDPGVPDAELELIRRVGDDRAEGHFAAGSGRRGNGDQGQRFSCDRVPPLVVPYFSSVGCHDAHALGAVDGASASDGENAGRAERPGGCGALHDVFVLGVWFHRAEDLERNPLFFESPDDWCENPRVDHAAVRNEKRTLFPQLLQHRGDGGGNTSAEFDPRGKLEAEAVPDIQENPLLSCLLCLPLSPALFLWAPFPHRGTAADAGTERVVLNTITASPRIFTVSGSPFLTRTSTCTFPGRPIFSP